MGSQLRKITGFSGFFHISSTLGGAVNADFPKFGILRGSSGMLHFLKFSGNGQKWRDLTRSWSTLQKLSKSVHGRKSYDTSKLEGFRKNRKSPNFRTVNQDFLQNAVSFEIFYRKLTKVCIFFLFRVITDQKTFWHTYTLLNLQSSKFFRFLIFWFFHDFLSKNWSLRWKCCLDYSFSDNFRCFNQKLMKKSWKNQNIKNLKNFGGCKFNKVYVCQKVFWSVITRKRKNTKTFVNFL